ncbi:GNAT family N-acetyltransferase [Alteribacillus sp. HJP-4]|uniref:GNAT family N-acetyltransferase n=1 Tax=Alteribacillus sp. HJP-4 TaxID=2775394 RepID=UPI0035CCFFD3
MEIYEMQSDKEIRAAFPLLKQLRTHLDENTYVELVKEAMLEERYHLAVLESDGDLAAAAGFKEMTTLYYGRFVWVCDLVTDETKRSQGYGEKLLHYVHEWAARRGCECVALSSGIQREKAHRFYEDKMNYHKASYVFKSTL